MPLNGMRQGALFLSERDNVLLVMALTARMDEPALSESTAPSWQSAK